MTTNLCRSCKTSIPHRPGRGAQPTRCSSCRSKGPVERCINIVATVSGWGRCGRIATDRTGTGARCAECHQADVEFLARYFAPRALEAA
jgi:hypothetical protein